MSKNYIANSPVKGKDRIMRINLEDTLESKRDHSTLVFNYLNRPRRNGTEWIQTLVMLIVEIVESIKELEHRQLSNLHYNSPNETTPNGRRHGNNRRGFDRLC